MRISPGRCGPRMISQWFVRASVSVLSAAQELCGADRNAVSRAVSCRSRAVLRDCGMGMGRAFSPLWGCVPRPGALPQAGMAMRLWRGASTQPVLVWQSVVSLPEVWPAYLSALEENPSPIQPIQHAPGRGGQERMLEHRFAKRFLQPADPRVAGAAKPPAEGVAQHVGGDVIHSDHNQRKRPTPPAH